jgi:hypothetical protein
VSLDKARVWMKSQGRRDISEGRSARELEVLDRICRIALDLDGVMLHQGAKAGIAGEQPDLMFGRKVKGRKTPILFAGVVLKPKGDQWMRRSDPPETDAVRLHLKISEAGANRSEWGYLFAEDDGLKSDAEWRWCEISERMDVSGDELLDLLEDAFFEVVGI